MKIVNMHEAKTHLSRLVREAVAGEPFIIAIRGKPMVIVSALEPGDEGYKPREDSGSAKRTKTGSGEVPLRPARRETRRARGKT